MDKNSILKIDALYEGENPRGLVLTAGLNDDTESGFREIWVSVYGPGSKEEDLPIADLVIGINDQNEIRVLSTLDGDGGEHKVALFPERAFRNCIKYVD